MLVRFKDGTSARLLADDEAAMERAIERADLICFSGITMAILSATPWSGFLRILETARSDGRTIAFEPNLRQRTGRIAEPWLP